MRLQPLFGPETVSNHNRENNTGELLIALAIQVAILIIMLRSYLVLPRMWRGEAEAGGLLPVGTGFGLVAAFSLAPQIVAWSALHTSADVICYMYVAFALLLAGALRLPARVSARSSPERHAPMTAKP